MSPAEPIREGCGEDIGLQKEHGEAEVPVVPIQNTR